MCVLGKSFCSTCLTWCTDYLWLLKKLKRCSLIIKAVGHQQWLLEHIRSGLVLISVKTRELLQNKSLTYNWTWCTDYLCILKKSERGLLENKGCGNSAMSFGIHLKWIWCWHVKKQWVIKKLKSKIWMKYAHWPHILPKKKRKKILEIKWLLRFYSEFKTY